MDRLIPELVEVIGDNLPFRSLAALSETSQWLHYCVQPLLERELAATYKRRGTSLLSILVLRNNVLLTRKLLSPPYSVNSESQPDVNRLLAHAISFGTVEIATMLMDDFGADPLGSSFGGADVAISLAAYSGQVAIAELLLSRDVPIAATYAHPFGPPSQADHTALDTAARAGRASFVKFLLTQNIEWALYHPLALAIEDVHTGVVHALLDAGAPLDKIDDPTSELYQAFLAACSHWRGRRGKEVIHCILERGAPFPPTTTNPDGSIAGPLFSALNAYPLKPGIVSTLMKHGGPQLVTSKREAKAIVRLLAENAKETLDDLDPQTRSEGTDAQAAGVYWHALCGIVPVLLENGLDRDLLERRLRKKSIPRWAIKDMMLEQVEEGEDSEDD